MDLNRVLARFVSFVRVMAIGVMPDSTRAQLVVTTEDKLLE